MSYFGALVIVVILTLIGVAHSFNILTGNCTFYGFTCTNSESCCGYPLVSCCRLGTGTGVCLNPVNIGNFFLLPFVFIEYFFTNFQNLIQGLTNGAG